LVAWSSLFADVNVTWVAAALLSVLCYDAETWRVVRYHENYNRLLSRAAALPGATNALHIAVRVCVVTEEGKLRSVSMHRWVEGVCFSLHQTSISCCVALGNVCDSQTVTLIVQNLFSSLKTLLAFVDSTRDSDVAQWSEVALYGPLDGGVGTSSEYSLHFCVFLLSVRWSTPAIVPFLGCTCAQDRQPWLTALTTAARHGLTWRMSEMARKAFVLLTAQGCEVTASGGDDKGSDSELGATETSILPVDLIRFSAGIHYIGSLDKYLNVVSGPGRPLALLCTQAEAPGVHLKAVLSACCRAAIFLPLPVRNVLEVLARVSSK
jgi:hypothetical protein